MSSGLREFFLLLLDALRSLRIDAGPTSAWEVEELKKQGFNLLVTPRDLYPSGRPEAPVIAATGRFSRTNRRG